MNIIYPVTKYYSKEVHSKDYDKILKQLESLMNMGLIVEIHKYHTDTGWELHAITNGYGTGWTYQGNWEEEIGESTEVDMEVDWPETVKRNPPDQSEYIDFPGDLY